MASVSDVVEQLSRELERMNYPIDEQARSVLFSIFETFDADELSKANEEAKGELFELFSTVAISAASHRREKFPHLSDRKIAASDFLPAFLYVSMLGNGRGDPFLYSFELPFLGIRRAYRPLFRRLPPFSFSRALIDSLRRCCPWC